MSRFSVGDQVIIAYSPFNFLDPEREDFFAWLESIPTGFANDYRTLFTHHMNKPVEVLDVHNEKYTISSGFLGEREHKSFVALNLEVDGKYLEPHKDFTWAEIHENYMEMFDPRWYTMIGGPEGWRHIIINALDELLRINDDYGEYGQVHVAQTKTKFGGLRFHAEFRPKKGAAPRDWHFAHSLVHNIAYAAERQASTRCEPCGEYADHQCKPLFKESHWLYTLCNKCRDELREEKLEGCKKTLAGYVGHKVESGETILWYSDPGGNGWWLEEADKWSYHFGFDDKIESPYSAYVAALAQLKGKHATD